jgi:hypothetical protein
MALRSRCWTLAQATHLSSKVERAGVDLNYHYQVWIDGSVKGFKYIGDLENCWTGGTVRSLFFDEVYDFGTQSGGRVADPQDFTDVQYKTDTWHLMTRTVNASCDIVERTTQRCRTSSSDTNNFISYDTRFP